jgi:4'-phosphopantetheinyl transferase
MALSCTGRANRAAGVIGFMATQSLPEFRTILGRTFQPGKVPASDAVHVFALALDSFRASSASLAAALDGDEQARAARFVNDADRVRFIISHGLTRELLSFILAIPPSMLRFAVGIHGKPRLHEPAFDLRFNLSHARERALLAVASGRDVGIDIEEERPIEELELARRFFSAAEYSALIAAPDRRAAFFRCWTRKESFVKARGDGLSFRLDAFDVSVQSEAEHLLLSCDGAPAEMARWTMKPVPLGPGYAAALAAEGHDWRLILHA